MLPIIQIFLNLCLSFAKVLKKETQHKTNGILEYREKEWKNSCAVSMFKVLKMIVRNRWLNPKKMSNKQGNCPARCMTKHA